MIKEMEKLLNFVRDNPGTIYTFPGVFRTTLEYIQFLNNDFQDIAALHDMIKKRINRSREPSTPHHAQTGRLNEFRDHLCRLADAIEADKSGRWGDTSPPSYARAYQNRKAYYEDRMEYEWRSIQLLLQAKELQQCWSID